MIRSVLHRLEKLEGDINPGKPPMIITVQYISAEDKSVVGEYDIEVSAWAPKRPKRAKGK
jgi:hypothetical protein